MPALINACSSPSALTDQWCQVIAHTKAGSSLKRLLLKPETSGYWALPGQFVMLDLPTERFYFRRPFSILEVLADGSLALYYKVVGDGTRQMSDLIPGDEVRILGPLGLGFPPLKQPETTLLIGGGIGIAPLYFVGAALAQASAKPLFPPHCIYGVRTSAELGLTADLERVFGADRLHLTTEDGSAGLKGRVTDWLQANPEAIAAAEEAFICGPTPMMRAVSDYLLEHNPAMEVFVSLEERMPCGTGACSGCVIPRADQLLPSKTCLEGPVFNARSIRWDWDAPY